MSTDQRFEGQVAVVTGAGSGMGRAIAGALAREGAKVVVAEFEPVRGAAVAAEINDAAPTGGHGSGQATFIQADVGDPKQVDSLFDQVMSRYGDLHILVNNAGIWVGGPLLDLTVADWRRQMATNLDGVFFCTQAAARIMVPKGRGKIVNFASTAAFVSTGSPSAAYCASKAGVRHLTAVIGAELAPRGVHVNAVAPGTILTGMSGNSLDSPEKVAKEVTKIPLGRIGMPEDMVGPVLFLCSSESDYVTGHTLVVDGGWLLF